MPDRFLIKIVVPMAVVSLLLLGLGAVAAWNVHRQQIITSNLIVAFWLLPKPHRPLLKNSVMTSPA